MEKLGCMCSRQGACLTKIKTSIPSWMKNISPETIGFPIELDRSLYTKEKGIIYKETDQGELALDAYLPVLDSPEPRPGVVMIHGGGWHRGGRFQMGLTHWAGYLASAGLCVFSIDYRLAPETTYPDSFKDCLDAIDYVVHHAETFDLDPERIGLWGDSAGGHLVLLAGSSQTRSDFTGPKMRTKPGSLKAVVAWYPPTDLEALHQAERRVHTGSTTTARFVGSEPSEQPEQWKEVSPIEQVHAHSPPCLILQGTGDFLVPTDQATRYEARAREEGAAVELHVVEGAPHGFDRLAPGDEGRRLVVRSREFLVEALMETPSRVG
ncbi:MAG: hypothetical protein CL917_06145 [Deltaproteobacteria bacterium]|nr:hypothetical protein [Deltaproteobacteria bacterium]